MKRVRAGLAVALVALALGGCGDDEPIPPLTTTGGDPAAGAPAPGSDPPPAPPGEQGAQPPPEGKPSGPAESGGGDPRVTALERDAARTVIDFVDALDARDGSAVCDLLVAGALADLELPRQRGDCAASVTASIGYRDPRGLPVWEGGRVASVPIAELDPGDGSAKVVATVVTRFADRDQVSIEDDIVYLVRDGDGWLIAKPSSTLYRAVGIADVPPSVLSPP